MSHPRWISINLPWSVPRSVWAQEVQEIEEACFEACLPIRRELDRLVAEKFGTDLSDEDAVTFFRLGTAQFRELLRRGSERNSRIRKVRAKYEFWSTDYCTPGVYVELDDGRRLLLGDALVSGAGASPTD